jgi:hypothetical protein
LGSSPRRFRVDPGSNRGRAATGPCARRRRGRFRRRAPR